MAEGGHRGSSGNASTLNEEAVNEDDNKDMAQETSLKQEEKPEGNNSNMSTMNRQRGPTDREDKTTKFTDTVMSFDEDESKQENSQEENKDGDLGAFKELQNLFRKKRKRT